MSIANGPTALSDLTASTLGSHSLNEYVPLIGHENTDRILHKAKRIAHLHIVHVSSTFYGGGVSEILTPLTLLMNDLGIETGWRLIQGTPDFFGCTKKLHNALQGATADLSQK
jgi:trehalose synthase